jgi:hypothetical protein
MSVSPVHKDQLVDVITFRETWLVILLTKSFHKRVYHLDRRFGFTFHQENYAFSKNPVVVEFLHF